LIRQHLHEGRSRRVTIRTSGVRPDVPNLAVDYEGTPFRTQAKIDGASDEYRQVGMRRVDRLQIGCVAHYEASELLVAGRWLDEYRPFFDVLSHPTGCASCDIGIQQEWSERVRIADLGWLDAQHSERLYDIVEATRDKLVGVKYELVEQLERPHLPSSLLERLPRGVTTLRRRNSAPVLDVNDHPATVEEALSRTRHICREGSPDATR